MPDLLAELEEKITAALENQLAEATKNRDAIQGAPGLKPPEFWTHHAIAIATSQQIERRKNRMEK